MCVCEGGCVEERVSVCEGVCKCMRVPLYI